ncbi:MAG TPA: hypothetical protein VFS43_18430 [Polyangiaceae bacterium]|nr:hypothetical protein [Polyangiaceae bacterium]
MRSVVEHSARRIPEWLPMVQCIGSFRCNDTVRGSAASLSALTVVWFQDEYALPIQEPALEQLAGLDWASLAVDVEL